MPCRKRTAKRKRNVAGFTYLEVLVALAVISIAFVALLNSHTISLRNQFKSRILSRATMLGEEKINEIEARGMSEFDEQEADKYDNGLLFVTTSGIFIDDEDTERFQPEWRRDYWWRTTVEETEYEGVRKAVVEVFWQRYAAGVSNMNVLDNQEAIPTVTLVTYVATTNRREDSRIGTTSSSSNQTRRSGTSVYSR
jgi:prepilin-type N-terminal cleavage/methylation domain-containing protein